MATVNLRDPFGFTKSLLFFLCKLRDTRNTVRGREKVRVKLMVDARPEGFGKKGTSTLIGFPLLDYGMTPGSSKRSSRWRSPVAASRTCWTSTGSTSG